MIKNIKNNKYNYNKLLIKILINHFEFLTNILK